MFKSVVGLIDIWSTYIHIYIYMYIYAHNKYVYIIQMWWSFHLIGMPNMRIWNPFVVRSAPNMAGLSKWSLHMWGTSYMGWTNNPTNHIAICFYSYIEKYVCRNTYIYIYISADPNFCCPAGFPVDLAATYAHQMVLSSDSSLLGFRRDVRHYFGAVWHLFCPSVPCCFAVR